MVNETLTIVLVVFSCSGSCYFSASFLYEYVHTVCGH